MTMRVYLIRNGFRSVNELIGISKYNRRTLNRYYNYDKETFRAIMRAAKIKKAPTIK